MTQKPYEGLNKEQRIAIEEIVKDVLGSDLSGQYGGHTLASLRNMSEGYKDLNTPDFTQQPRDICDTHLPAILQNLNAIRTTAESATHSIMNATESIQVLLGMLDEKMEQRIRKELTMIVQACAFQDLTGQRMMRIVDAVEEIELAVDGILSVMGDADATRRYKELDARRKKEAKSGKKNLGGPQDIIVKDKQAEIDSMFGS